jgi:hypothetical protein
VHQLALQGIDVIGHEAIHPRVGVEVAISALVLAKRHVDIEISDWEHHPSPLAGEVARRAGGGEHFAIPL